MDADIVIPAGEEFLVAVSLDSLPQDVEDIIEILQAETAPLSAWLDVAKGYLARGGEEQFLAILRQVVGDDVAAHYENSHFERVQAHCGLAQYEMAAARATQDPARLNDAHRHLKLAASIDSAEQTVQLGFGLLEIAKGNQVAAQIALEKAKKLRCQGRVSVAAHVALAQMHFQGGAHQKAMKEYLEAFRMLPDGPLAIRLGVAACAFKLGNYPLARVAYDRVLELDASNAEALAGLAALEFETDAGSVAQGLQYLLQSYEVDPTSAPVLTALASFALVREEYAVARDMAEAATQLAVNPEVLAASQRTLGRAQHALGNTGEAQRNYARSLRVMKTPLCHFGIAQMAIEQGEIKNATTELESVLDMVHSNVDALSLLGQLYLHAPARADQTRRIKDAAHRHAKNGKIQEMLGDVLAPTEPGRALTAYRAAIQLSQGATENGASGDAPGPSTQLLNNCAVLEYRAGNMTEARNLLVRAQEDIAAGKQPDPGPALVTLRFNAARAQEASGDLRRAADGYRSILDDHPDHTDCMIRLACMARTRGHHDESVEWADKAMQTDGGHADAVSLLALWSLKWKDYSKTRIHGDRLLKGPGARPDDVYAHVLVGNLHLRSAPPESRRDTKSDRMARYQHWSNAAKHYKAALAADPGNIYAANGLGAVCAEMGQMDEAREIFATLRESAAATSGFVQLPDVWVNLGSIYLAKGDADEAVRMYNAANARFYNNKSTELLLYLARALYDENRLSEAKRVLLKALHIAPSNTMTMFNVALTMQQFAVKVLQTKRGDPSAEAVKHFSAAKLELTHAVGLFDVLQKRGAKFQYRSAAQLTQHITFCRATLKTAETYLANAQRDLSHHMQVLEQRQEAIKVMRETQELQKTVAAEKAALHRKKQEEAARQALEETKRRNEEWRHKHAQLQAAKDSAKEKKRQREAEVPAEAEDPAAAFFDEDSAEDSDYDEGRAKADEREHEEEENELRDAGYDSQDERGTADVPEAPVGKKRKTAPADDEDATLRDLGLDDDDDDEDANDGAAGDGGDAPPARRPRQVLDSDDES